MFCLLCLATFTYQDVQGPPMSQTSSTFSFLTAKQHSLHGCTTVWPLMSESLWFYLTTIYHHTAINIRETLPGTCFHFSWSQSPWSRPSRSYGESVFNILKKKPSCFGKYLYCITILLAVYTGFDFSTSFPNICQCLWLTRAMHSSLCWICEKVLPGFQQIHPTGGVCGEGKARRELQGWSNTFW